MERSRNRTPDEWMELIATCRASGLTDIRWCELNGINTNTFYNAIKRLRQNACEIPSKERLESMNLTTKPEQQEIVRIDVVDDAATRPIVALPAEVKEQPHFENHHTIEIELNGICLRITNDANPALVSKTIASLRCMVC